MIRRLAALLLWTYFAWYLAAMVASMTDGPAVAGPIAGVLTAGLAAVGWARHGIFRRLPRQTAAESA